MGTITRAFSSGGASSSSGKRYARSIMNLEDTKSSLVMSEYTNVTFDARAFEGVQIHEGDPLVTFVAIRSSNIPQVLIDRGSSVNVMY